MKTPCKKSWLVNLTLTTFHGFCILLTTEIVPMIFPNLNVVAHCTCGLGFLPAEAGYFLLCTLFRNLVYNAIVW